MVMIILKMHQVITSFFVFMAKHGLYEFRRIITILRQVSLRKLVLILLVVFKRTSITEICQLNILYDVVNHYSMRIYPDQDILRLQVSKEYLLFMQALNYLVQLLGKHLEYEIFVQNSL